MICIQITNPHNAMTDTTIKQAGAGRPRWSNGEEHWAKRHPDIDLFLWRRPPATAPAGTILFVHGSSMASQPTFDLDVPGQPDTSVMAWFSQRGFDTWCLDNEGYGRSSKHRDINFDIENGVEDLTAATSYILGRTGSGRLHLYGVSSGALKAAVLAQRHPERVGRLALDAFVWTGQGSPTLTDRKKRIAEWRAANRRPISLEFVRSIFMRDGIVGGDDATIESFADAILSLDDSVPNGTYVDMCEKLPVVAPEQLHLPVLILRGEFDGIATFDDLTAFFSRLPHHDKQFSVIAGGAHGSLHGPRRLAAHHAMHSFFTQP